MYRVITYLALQKELSLNDEEVLSKLTASTNIDMVRTPDGKQAVFCNGTDVTEIIRDPQINQNVSYVAVHPGVRRELVRMQRALAQNKDVVMDGRDAGTTILPRAKCKIFLTASLEERAQRRYLEMKAKGYNKSFKVVQEELARRDYIDQNRASSPLIPAQDAVIVDTTHLNPEEVITEILKIYQIKKEEEK
jgi:cytidylate kinase